MPQYTLTVCMFMLLVYANLNHRCRCSRNITTTHCRILMEGLLWYCEYKNCCEYLISLSWTQTTFYLIYITARFWTESTANRWIPPKEGQWWRIGCLSEQAVERTTAVLDILDTMSMRISSFCVEKISWEILYWQEETWYWNKCSGNQYLLCNKYRAVRVWQHPQYDHP